MIDGQLAMKFNRKKNPCHWGYKGGKVTFMTIRENDSGIKVLYIYDKLLQLHIRYSHIQSLRSQDSPVYHKDVVFLF